MIRKSNNNDINEIIRIYSAEYKAMEDELEAIRKSENILVYDDEGVKGFSWLAFGPGICKIEMAVDSPSLINEAGAGLWEEAQSLIKSNDSKFIFTYYLQNSNEWKEFYSSRGFEPWYSIYRMTYTGQSYPEPTLSVKPYEDCYYDEKMKKESEAFSVLRQEIDEKPFNWYEGASDEALLSNRKATFENREFIHLFFVEEIMIGASMVKHGEIELLFVSLEHQGNGYGRSIMEFSINRALEQNPMEVTLNAVAKNESALKLYTSMGFTASQIQEKSRVYL
jgi:GNAT superfamily N-acetyltransferase